METRPSGVRAAAALILLLALPVAAVELPPHDPRPGGIAVIDLGERDAAPRVTLAGKPVLTVQSGGRWHAVVGIPLAKAPGRADLAIDGEPASRYVEVLPHRYREQFLTVAPTYVNPPAEALARIARERELISAAIASFSAFAPTTFALVPPAPGKQSDSFGSRRFFNKEPRSPHRGMDIAGATGTPVVAAGGGTVIEAGNFYFTGNAVFVDHGQGLVTLYAHLDTIEVGLGDKVTAGQQLGTIGSTGRVTGPHLHFATYLNGTPVDPSLLLAAPGQASQ